VLFFGFLDFWFTFGFWVSCFDFVVSGFLFCWRLLYFGNLRDDWFGIMSIFGTFWV